jgi:hypothetical protein
MRREALGSRLELHSQDCSLHDQASLPITLRSFERESIGHRPPEPSPPLHEHVPFGDLALGRAEEVDCRADWVDAEGSRGDQSEHQEALRTVTGVSQLD